MTGIAEEKSADRKTQGSAFRGHVRVHEASAADKEGIEGRFPDGERRRWAGRALASGQSTVLDMEIFEGRTWVPLGQAIADAGGELAVLLLPRFRGIGLCSAAIRAAVQALRDLPLTVITARVDERERAAAAAFERAGFTPSGMDASGGCVWILYSLSLRGECTPFNVWI
jgi:RimJ/RimL family protein N-acetyltransferase